MSLSNLPRTSQSSRKEDGTEAPSTQPQSHEYSSRMEPGSEPRIMEHLELTQDNPPAFPSVDWQTRASTATGQTHRLLRSHKGEKAPSSAFYRLETGGQRKLRTG